MLLCTTHGSRTSESNVPCTTCCARDSERVKDEIKTSPNNNSVGVKAAFKISAGKKRQNCDNALRCCNNSRDYIGSQKGLQTSNLSVTNRLRRNTWLFLFNKLHLITQALRPEQQNS